MKTKLHSVYQCLDCGYCFPINVASVKQNIRAMHNLQDCDTKIAKHIADRMLEK